MSQVYLIIKYENYNIEGAKLQPLNILFIFKNKEDAIKKAHDLAKEVYGGYISDFDNQKQKHLEKLATKMLDEQEKLNKLKDKKLNTDFLDLF